MKNCEPAGFESLLRANRALRILRGCNRVLARATDEKTFLDETCRIIVNEGAFRMAWIGIIEHNKKQSISVVASSGFEAGYIERLDLTWADSERGRGPSGVAVRTGRPAIARDIENDPNFAPWREDAIKRGYYSSICVPLMGESPYPFGLMAIYSEERDAFDRNEVELINELGNDISYGITSLKMREHHRLTEAALRESELSYHELFEAADDLIYTYDLKRRLISVNSAAVKRLGYSRKEVLSKNFEFLIAPEYLDQALEMMRRKIDNANASTAHELDFLAKDGSRVPVEIISRLLIREGRPVGGMAIARDISKRRKAEIALRQKELDLQSSKKALQALLDASHEAALLIDTEGHILACNGNFARMIGKHDANEVLRGNVFEMMPEDMVRSHIASADKTLAMGTPVSFRDEFQGTRYDCAVYPILDEDNRTGALAVFARDITREEEAEKALAESERKTTAAIIASGVAHEFNNLNSIISGNLYLVIRQSDLPPKAKSRLEKVMRMAARAGSITENLLAFTRRERSKLALGSINEIVADVLQLTTSKRDARDIRINFKGPTLPRFKMDAGQVTQVIMNLVINAAHAMQAMDDKILDIEIGSRNNEAFIRITDNGCGIPEENLTHIFTPFFTTKKTHASSESENSHVHGSGLGLSVCEKIVYDHNGRIDVTSEQLKGTTFMVWLPMQDAETEDDTLTEEEPLAPRIGGKRLLVVDDEPDIREMIRCLMEPEGYEIIEAENAQQALKIVRTNPCAVALVDLLMPGMSGVDFIKALEYLPSAKRPVCLMLTGVLSDTVAHESGDLDIFATVRKPFEIETLIKMVAKAMAYSRQKISKTI